MVYTKRAASSGPGHRGEDRRPGHYRLSGCAGAVLSPVRRAGPRPSLHQGHLRHPAGSSPLEPIAFDIALKRSVLVQGRVTDKATGRPASGYVNAFAFADNPHVREFPGFRESQGSLRAPIGEDGRFEVAALPGRGLIACRSDVGRYRRGVGAATIKGYNPELAGLGEFPTLQGAASSTITTSWPRSTRPQGRCGDVGPPGRPRPIADHPRRRSRGPSLGGTGPRA